MFWGIIKKLFGGSRPAPRRVSGEELAGLMERGGEFVYLDVRAAKEILELGSVAGHIHIPMDELAGRVNEVPKGKPVVTL